MTLIRKYIISEFFRFFAMTFIAILAVYLCVEFLQKADDFIRLRADIRDVIAYFLYTIPAVATPSLPIAALLSTLLSLGNLSRHNEITALHAGGIGLTGIVAPVLFAGAALALLGFLNNEVLMPPAVSRAALIKTERIEKKKHLVIFQRRNVWLRGPDNSIVNIDFVPPDRNIMIGVDAYKMSADFTVRERIHADRLVLENGSWRFKDGTRYLIGKDSVVSSPVENDVFNLVESPEDLRMIIKTSDEMNFAELSEYVRRLKASGYYVARYEVDLHDKLAFPFSSLVMVLIATPLSLIRVRSGGAGRGITLAVLIAFAYWSVMSIGMTLGRSGAVPPALSAWFANILFLSAAAAVLHRMNSTR